MQAREALRLNYARGQEGWIAQFRSSGRDFSDRFRRARTPIRLLVGEHTRQFPAGVLREFAQGHANIDVQSVSDAAFFVMRQQPERVVEQLVGFHRGSESLNGRVSFNPQSRLPTVHS